MVKEDQVTLDTLQNKLTELNVEIDKLQVSLHESRKTYLKVEDDVIFAKVQRDQIEKQITEIQARNDFASAEDDARETEIKRLNQNLDGLLDKIKDEPKIDMLKLGEAGTTNPVKQLLDKHPHIIEKFKGMKIAFDPNKGVVAAGETVAEVYDQVDQKGLLGMVSFLDLK